MIKKLQRSLFCIPNSYFKDNFSPTSTEKHFRSNSTGLKSENVQFNSKKYLTILPHSIFGSKNSS